MLLALFLASGSALLGGALALAVRQRRALLELTRTFAFAAAAGVVALHLLPEALEGIGVRGLFYAAIGFAIPAVLEWRAHSLGPVLRDRGLSPARVSAEIGLLALVAHSLLEGVALSAAASGSGSHVDLEIALVAHHAPLTAAVILPFLALVSARGVALRVLAVSAAGGLGALSGQLGIFSALKTAGDAQSIAGAVMAGALLHVVADEICVQKFGALWERAADLTAAGIGIGIAVVSAIYGESSQGTRLVLALFALLLPCAPALLAADLVAALWKNRKRTLAARPELDAFLVTMRGLGIFAALAWLLIALAGFLLATAFAPGDGRPAEPSPKYVLRLIDGAVLRDPRRLIVFMLGAVLLALLPRAFEIPNLLGISLAAVAVLLLAALSASATAAVIVSFIALSANWDSGPALFINALAVGPLLARRGAWRGDAKKRFLGALMMLLLGAVAMVVLARPAFEDRVRSAALALPTMPAETLARTFGIFPVESIAASLLFLLSLLAMWRTGARGFFAPLRNELRERLLPAAARDAASEPIEA